MANGIMWATIDDNYIRKLNYPFVDRQNYYSSLEELVTKDMHKEGINYPYCEVEAVQNYWKERLE